MGCLSVYQSLSTPEVCPPCRIADGGNPPVVPAGGFLALACCVSGLCEQGDLMASFTPSTNAAMMLAMRRFGPSHAGSALLSSHMSGSSGLRGLPMPEIRIAPVVSAPPPPPPPAPAPTEPAGGGSVPSAPVVSVLAKASRESVEAARPRPVRPRYLPLLSGYWTETLSGTSRDRGDGGSTLSGRRSLLGE